MNALVQAPGRATVTVSSSVVSASIPLSPGRSLYLPTQSQAWYRSASARRDLVYHSYLALYSQCMGENVHVTMIDIAFFSP